MIPRVPNQNPDATKALDRGDYQFAGEIVGELEAEGNIDPQITPLRTQIDQISRQRTIAQLLDSAKARFEEDEDPLALSKLQEVFNLDPTNVLALSLKSRSTIDAVTARSRSGFNWRSSTSTIIPTVTREKRCRMP